MYDMIHNSFGAGVVLVNKVVTVYCNTFFSIISILARNSLSLETQNFMFTHMYCVYRRMQHDALSPLDTNLYNNI